MFEIFKKIIFGIFRKRIKISLLNEKWEIITPILKVDVVPRINEYVWIEEQESYFKVIMVAHNIKDKHGIFIILEKFNIEGK